MVNMSQYSGFYILKSISIGFDMTNIPELYLRMEVVIVSSHTLRSGLVQGRMKVLMRYRVLLPLTAEVSVLLLIGCCAHVAVSVNLGSFLWVPLQ